MSTNSEKFDVLVLMWKMLLSDSYYIFNGLSERVMKGIFSLYRVKRIKIKVSTNEIVSVLKLTHQVPRVIFQETLTIVYKGQNDHLHVVKKLRAYAQKHL